MQLNRIQQQIFKKLSKDEQLEPDEYVAKHSQRFIGEQVQQLSDLTEQQGDDWITKAYIKSLG